MAPVARRFHVVVFPQPPVPPPAPAVDDGTIFFQCTRCGTKYKGYFKIEVITRHIEVHRQEDVKCMEAHRKKTQEQAKLLTQNKGGKRSRR